MIQSYREPKIEGARIRAREIILEMGIKKSEDICLEDIISKRGLKIIERPLTGQDGCFMRPQSKILVRNTVFEPGQKRFIIAHELGHFELHEGESQLTSSTFKEDFRYWYDKISPLEREANVFAAELLMPKNLFKPLCDRNMPSIKFFKKLAETFNVTLTAAAFRYIEFSDEKCAIVSSKDKQIRWHQSSKSFNFWIEPKSPLNKDTCTFDLFEGKEIQEGFHEVLAGAWISSEKLPSALTIQEDSIFMPNYSTALSLLWIKDDEEEEDY